MNLGGLPPLVQTPLSSRQSPRCPANAHTMEYSTVSIPQPQFTSPPPDACLVDNRCLVQPVAPIGQDEGLRQSGCEAVQPSTVTESSAVFQCLTREQTHVLHQWDQSLRWQRQPMGNDVQCGAGEGRCEDVHAQEWNPIGNDGSQPLSHDPVSAYLASLLPYTTSGIGGGSNGPGVGLNTHLTNVKQRLRKHRLSPSSRLSYPNEVKSGTFVPPSFSPGGHVALPEFHPPNFSGLPRSNTTESSCALSVIASGVDKAPIPHHHVEGCIGEWGNGYLRMDQLSRIMPSLLSSDLNPQHLDAPSPSPYPTRSLQITPRLDRESKGVEQEMRQQAHDIIRNSHPQNSLFLYPRFPQYVHETSPDFRTAVPSLTDAYVSHLPYFATSNPVTYSTPPSSALYPSTPPGQISWVNSMIRTEPSRPRHHEMHPDQKVPPMFMVQSGTFQHLPPGSEGYVPSWSTGAEHERKVRDSRDACEHVSVQPVSERDREIDSVASPSSTSNQLNQMLQQAHWPTLPTGMGVGTGTGGEVGDEGELTRNIDELIALHELDLQNPLLGSDARDHYVGEQSNVGNRIAANGLYRIPSGSLQRFNGDGRNPWGGEGGRWKVEGDTCDMKRAKLQVRSARLADDNVAEGALFVGRVDAEILGAGGEAFPWKREMISKQKTKGRKRKVEEEEGGIGIEPLPVVPQSRPAFVIVGPPLVGRADFKAAQDLLGEIVSVDFSPEVADDLARVGGFSVDAAFPALEDVETGGALVGPEWQKQEMRSGGTAGEGEVRDLNLKTWQAENIFADNVVPERECSDGRAENLCTVDVKNEGDHDQVVSHATESGDKDFDMKSADDFLWEEEDRRISGAAYVEANKEKNGRHREEGRICRQIIVGFDIKVESNDDDEVQTDLEVGDRTDVDIEANNDKKIGNESTKSPKPADYNRECSEIEIAPVLSAREDVCQLTSGELTARKAALVAILSEIQNKWAAFRGRSTSMEDMYDSVGGGGSCRVYTGAAHRSMSTSFRRVRDFAMVELRATTKAMELRRHVPLQARSIEIHMPLQIDETIGEGINDDQQRLAVEFLQRNLCTANFEGDYNFGETAQSSGRAQRGLPERAVATLRAWMFDHFLQPYPTDAEKLNLAQNTGLRRVQVSNWFINARVRIWKPMIEAFYAEMQTSVQDQPCAVPVSWETKESNESPPIHGGGEIEQANDSDDVEADNNST